MEVKLQAASLHLLAIWLAASPHPRLSCCAGVIPFRGPFNQATHVSGNVEMAKIAGPEAEDDISVKVCLLNKSYMVQGFLPWFSSSSDTVVTTEDMILITSDECSLFISVAHP